MNQEIPFDLDDLSDSRGEEPASQSPRFYASMFLRRLKDTGWVEEREGSYEEESQIVVNHRIVPIIRALQSPGLGLPDTLSGTVQAVPSTQSDSKRDCHWF